MSINKSGFSSMVYKHLRKPVLIAGVLIGGASMFAGAAQADVRSWLCNFQGVAGDTTCGSFSNWTYVPAFTSPPAPFPDPYPNPPSPDSLLLGDKILSNISYAFETNTSAGTLYPAGTLEFIWTDPDNDLTSYQDDTWSVATTFIPPAVSGDLILGPATGTLNYTLSIVGGQTFKNVKLDSDYSAISGGVVSKYINDSAFPMGNPAIPGGSALLVSNNGNPVGPVPLGGTSVNVTDTYSVTNAGSLISFNNDFTQTPAPLPILGVGAAFGSIRKLRKFSSQLKTFSMG